MARTKNKHTEQHENTHNTKTQQTFRINYLFVFLDMPPNLLVTKQIRFISPILKRQGIIHPDYHRFNGFHVAHQRIYL